MFSACYLGSLLSQVAEFDRSKQCLKFAIENYRLERDFAAVQVTGQDTKSIAYAWLGWSELRSGQVAKARQAYDSGVAHSESISHPFSLSISLSMAGLGYAESGHLEQAFQYCRRCIQLCDAQNMPFWRTWAVLSEGVGLVRSGQVDERYARILQSIEIFDAIGSKNSHGGFHSWLSIALSKLQRWDEARRGADFAILRCNETAESVWLPSALHARGVAEGNDAEAAERWLNEAIETAAMQKNRLLEIRAANSLAQVWMANVRGEEARALLSPLCEKFDEDESMLDVKEARLLLQQLQ